MDVDVDDDDKQYTAKMKALGLRVLGQAVEDAAGGDAEALAWLADASGDLRTWARHAGLDVSVIQAAAQHPDDLARTWKRIRAEADGVPALTVSRRA